MIKAQTRIFMKMLSCRCNINASKQKKSVELECLHQYVSWRKTSPLTKKLLTALLPSVSVPLPKNSSKTVSKWASALHPYLWNLYQNKPAPHTLACEGISYMNIIWWPKLYCITQFCKPLNYRLFMSSPILCLYNMLLVVSFSILLQ